MNFHENRRVSLRIAATICLLAALAAPPASAAAPVKTPTPASATASGSANNLTLDINIIVPRRDKGKTGKLYIGALLGKQWYLRTQKAWVPWKSGPLPAYSSGKLGSRTVSLYAGEDVSTFSGAEIYAGYGTSDADMLNGNKYTKVYTIK